MNRLLVAPEKIAGDLARVDGESFHYLSRVLRLRVGDRLEVFDGRGSTWDAEIRSMESDEASIALLGAPRLSSLPRVTLAQGLAKGDKLDLVVQKATELGVSRIAPLQLDRCVVQLDRAKGEARATRWRRIAEEASRQSGSAEVPRVDEPSSLREFLQAARARGERVALLYEEQDQDVRLGEWLRAQAGEPIALIVGPEGGISPAEVEAVREAGGAVLSLGPKILRTETVGIAALAIVLHLSGDLG